MTFGNGGITMDIIEENGVLGIQAQHQQYGIPSTKSFLPLLWDPAKYKHHFDVDSQLEYARPDYLFRWLAEEMTTIADWLQRNPTKTLLDYAVVRKLTN